MPRQSRPPHECVDWATTARDSSGQLRVAVHCPACAGPRMELAKSVRTRILDGTFTGRCRQHRLSSGGSVARPFDHPSIDWNATRRTAAGLRVQVTCPHCQQSRDVDARAVRQQLRTGKFTGRCRADRLLGKKLPNSQDRPAHPFVDWDDWDVVVDGNQCRRRTVTRVSRPECAAVARYNTAYLVRLIRTARFSPYCAAHRPLEASPIESTTRSALATAARVAAAIGP